jgi:hypothetical protein
MAYPMPLAAPVTTAVLFANSFMIDPLVAQLNLFWHGSQGAAAQAIRAGRYPLQPSRAAAHKQYSSTNA